MHVSDLETSLPMMEGMELTFEQKLLFLTTLKVCLEHLVEQALKAD